MDWANGLVVDGIWEALVLVVCFGKIECHTKHLNFFFLLKLLVNGIWEAPAKSLFFFLLKNVFICFLLKESIYLFI